MDEQRNEMIADAMRSAGYDALVCRLPQHVVMLTGYQPVLGNTFCVLTLGADGRPQTRLAVPSDEEEHARSAHAVAVAPFAEETMTRIDTTIPAVREPLRGLLASAGLGAGAVIGVEGGHAPMASYYTQMGTPGPLTTDLLGALLPGAQFRDATQTLESLSAIKTDVDLRWMRHGEAVALAGFTAARDAIHVGAGEADVLGATYMALVRAGYAVPDVWHVMAHAHVMSGPRAAEAYKAFNLTSGRALEHGDTVLVQMELALNGYWVELTRTFFVGAASDEWRRAHEACIRAQDAALKVIRAGVSGRDADAAARDVMRAAGYGDAFKHGLGHGFGFQAINHAAEPILHPASTSTLRAGNVHNMEPAVYLDGLGGDRLNDNVLVTADGCEHISSALPRELEWLVVGG